MGVIWHHLPHDDPITGKGFPVYWPFAWGVHRPPMDSPHKRQITLGFVAFLCTHKQTVEQAIKLPVIWDAMMRKWCLSNVMYIHTSQTNDHGSTEYNKIPMHVMNLYQMTILRQLYLRQHLESYLPLPGPAHKNISILDSTTLLPYLPRHVAVSQTEGSE